MTVFPMVAMQPKIAVFRDFSIRQIYEVGIGRVDYYFSSPRLVSRLLSAFVHEKNVNFPSFLNLFRDSDVSILAGAKLNFSVSCYLWNTSY